MGKIRLYLLARELGISNNDLIKALKDLGVEVKSHMSTVEEETARIIKEMFGNEKDKETETETKKRKEIRLKKSATITSIAESLEEEPKEIMKSLIEKGLMININDKLSGDILNDIADALDIRITVEEKEEKKKPTTKKKSIDKSKLTPRPPVVTIMGHVDHGKTLLLDVIRETKVVETEAGGITQHIGAYQIEVNGKTITFLDTPGHEAFTTMRARGAQVTDIAVLVVAADDGVMPQTVEAINHARDAGITIIVAINKIDKPNANPDRVKQQLSDHNLVPEDWGGDTVCVEMSALQRTNIEELLEMILLIAEMEDYRADSKAKTRGIIIESQLDKGRGPVVTALIKEGTLSVGDPIVAGTAYGKVRALFNDKGERVKEAGPATPIEVLGLSDVPDAGDILELVQDEKTARNISTLRKGEKRDRELTTDRAVNLEEFFSRMSQEEVKELKLIIKGDVHGSVEAIKESLERIRSDEVKLQIIHSGVGGITESDVILAAASRAIIIGFNVRPDSNARKVAERENVDIRTYRIIYQVIDDIKKALEGLLEPEVREKVTGRAEVRRTFKVPRTGTVAGLYIQEGKIHRNSLIRLIRDGVVMHEGKISSLKRFQDDVREVEENYECGLALEGFQDIKENDILEAYVLEEIKRTID